MKSDVEPRPTRIQSAPSKSTEKATEKSTEKSNSDARVVPDFKTGTVFLQGPDGDVGLDWKKGDANPVRALPPGEYRLRTARIERETGDDHWFISISGLPGRKFELRAGTSTELAVPADIKFKAHARRRGARLRMGFAITDAKGRGLSIFANDKRVAVTYKVLGEDGEVLTSGVTDYG